MERKLVKQGRNALTVTLPSTWLRSKALVAGDCVNIDAGNESLTISTTMKASKNEITFNFKDEEVSMAYHSIQGAYIEGYDQIEIIHDNPRLFQKAVKTLLGMIIVKHSQTSTIYKSIVAVPEDNFATVVRRAAHILLQQARTLEQLAKGDATKKEVDSDEALLDFNLRYCMRYLNKYQNQKGDYRYFLLCSTLESAGDIITEIAKVGCSPETAKIIVKGIQDYNKHLFSNDLKKLYKNLKAFRNKIKQNTFSDGLAFMLAETLYNNIGFIVKPKGIILEPENTR